MLRMIAKFGCCKYIQYSSFIQAPNRRVGNLLPTIAHFKNVGNKLPTLLRTAIPAHR